MEHAIFDTHQTSGTCAGMCTCDRMHQMENTEYIISEMCLNLFVTFSWYVTDILRN